MKWSVIILLAIFATKPAWAVATGNSFQTTQPTNVQVPYWTIGWPKSGTTGWNYVGQAAGASGIYLGNGWVLTAAHVGIGAFILNGVTYQAVAGSGHYLTVKNADGSTSTPDLILYQLATSPPLSPLTISQNAPVPLSQNQTGSSVVMIGYGGGSGESWGYDSVDYINYYPVTLGYYNSNDFIAFFGTYYSGAVGNSLSTTNNSSLVGGDSGGGDFIYNPSTQMWELAGINEVIGSGTVNNQKVSISGFVQLSSYATQIDAIVNASIPSDSPTLPIPGLLIMSCLLVIAASRKIGQRAFPTSRF